MHNPLACRKLNFLWPLSCLQIKYYRPGLGMADMQEVPEWPYKRFRVTTEDFRVTMEDFASCTTGGRSKAMTMNVAEEHFI